MYIIYVLDELCTICMNKMLSVHIERTMMHIVHIVRTKSILHSVFGLPVYWYSLFIRPPCLLVLTVY